MLLTLNIDKHSNLLCLKEVSNEEKSFISLTPNLDKHSSLVFQEEVIDKEKRFMLLTLNLDKHSSLLCHKENKHEQKMFCHGHLILTNTLTYSANRKSGKKKKVL
jgi:hypothetical protein